MAGGSRFFGVLGSPIYNRVVRRHTEALARPLVTVDL